MATKVRMPEFMAPATALHPLIPAGAFLAGPVHHIIQLLLGLAALTGKQDYQVMHLLFLIYPECL
jgi:hypothetical protein